MKQTTKAQFKKGVKQRGSEPFGKFDVTPISAIQAVTGTLLSAIRQGYDKIRINDQLHVTVKKHKGGKSRHFPTGELKQNPDYYVIKLVITPDLEKALHDRDVGSPTPVIDIKSASNG